MLRSLTNHVAAASFTLASSVAIILLLFGTASHALAQDLPQHVGKVNDFAELLQPSDRTTLEAQLADLERATSAEVAVVTIKTLYGQPIEHYATTMFNTWGIGKKGKDNGVLVLVALDEKTMRIEVGYGLEGVLPDGLAGAIIREQFRPKFRDGNYRQGILDGTARVMDIVRRNETLTPAQIAAIDKAAADARKSWGMAVFLSIFVALGGFVCGTGLGARVITQTLFGVLFGTAPIVFGSMVAPMPAVVLLALLGLALTAWGRKVGSRPGWQQSTRGATSRSGWVLSGAGRSSTSSGGSSRSSSGGSFGGGRSGGGGASGSW